MSDKQLISLVAAGGIVVLVVGVVLVLKMTKRPGSDDMIQAVGTARGDPGHIRAESAKKGLLHASTLSTAPEKHIATQQANLSRPSTATSTPRAQDIQQESPTPGTAQSLAPSRPRRTTITGAAWLIRDGGNSDLLRGLHIVVLPAIAPRTAIAACLEHNIKAWESHRSMEEQFKDLESSREEVKKADAAIAKIKRMIPELAAQMPTEKAYLLVDQTKNYIPDFRPAIPFLAITEGKTNVDGKYTISELPEGDYFLYAAIDSRQHFIEWLIPLHAKGGSMTVDLDNDSAVTIQNVH